MIEALPTRIIKVLNLNYNIPVSCILDIGCGSGEFSLLLKKSLNADSVYGIEMSPNGAALSNEKGVITSDIDLNNSQFPYGDDFFGMVFAGEVMEHLIQPDIFLDEIFRTLSPGGHLVLTIPNISSWHCRLQLLMGFQPYAIPISMQYRWVGAFLAKQRDKGALLRKHTRVNTYGGFNHVQFFTSRGACALLKAHDFGIIDVIGTTTDEFTVKLPSVIGNSIKWLDDKCAYWPSLASGVIIHAIKPTADRKG